LLLIGTHCEQPKSRITADARGGLPGALALAAAVAPQA
jgi:hypothetical protein